MILWIGAFAFGGVLGWILYRTLRRMQETPKLTNLATILGAFVGAIPVGVLGRENALGCYFLGIAVGFFGYLIVANITGSSDDFMRHR